jgi:uncharacterized protein YdeI (YjbR/CyaY-like superfamily)
MATTGRDRTKPAGRTSAKNDGDRVLALGSAAEWEAWLRANHTRSAAVFLRIPKKNAASGLNYASALDAALAWGWIDSQKRAFDDTAWLQRFSRRAPQSPWSKINRAKAEALIANGVMEAPGLAEVERAKRDGRWERAYDGAKTSAVPRDLAEAFDGNARAKALFETLDGANRYAILYRVATAKLPATRAKRIATFVAMCAAHQTLHPARASTRAKSASIRRSPSSP